MKRNLLISSLVVAGLASVGLACGPSPTRTRTTTVTVEQQPAPVAQVVVQAPPPQQQVIVQQQPVAQPTARPTARPTVQPTARPTAHPTSQPALDPWAGQPGAARRGPTAYGPGQANGGGGVCLETCRYSRDGECDDGRPGSHTDLCGFGTDCADCGPGYSGGSYNGAPSNGGACQNSCRYANDNECDDGRPGSHTSLCAYGTDCGDCGPG